MRVVHPERPHALVDPESDDAQQRVPERFPGRGREVDGVDVLVLLGRVLRVLDGPVGPRVEPFRVLAHPRVIRRALDREVERDLHPEALRGLHEATEVLERAELRMHRGVAALGAADGPGAARIAGAGRQRVVRALARGAADRMDGRQVDDIEAHAPDRGEPVDAVVEGAVAAGDPALRAREHLVPGREGGRGAVHHHLELPVVAREVRPRLDARHHLAQVGVEEDVEAAVARGRGLEPLERTGQRGRVRVPRPPARASEHRAAFEQLAGEVDLTAGQASPHLLDPGAEGVGPGLHRIAIARIGLEWERAGPAVVVHGRERRLAPVGLAHRAEADRRGEKVVSFLEDVGGDRQRVSHDPLDRIAAVVHRGAYVLDHDRAADPGHRHRSTR